MSTAIEFSFGFDTTQLASGAARAAAVMNRFYARIHHSSAIAFGAAAGAGAEAFNKITEAAKEAAEKVNGVFEQGAALEAMSQRTGIATGRLYQMQQALKMCDVEAEMLAPSINRLQLKMQAASEGSKAAGRDFEVIGLRFKDLLALSPDKQFSSVASAIAGLASPAARSAAAMGIFGRAGAELLPLFNNSGAVAEMGGALSSQAEVFQQNAEKFHEASVELKQAGIAFQGFYTGLSAGLVDAFNETLKTAGAINFVEKGREVGALIGKVLGWINIAWDNVANVMNLGRSVFAEMVGDALDIPDILLRGFETLPEFFTMFVDLMKSGWAGIAADLIDGAVSFGAKMAVGLEWACEGVKEFFGNKMFDLIGDISGFFQWSMNKAMDDLFSVMPDKLKKWLGVGNRENGKTLSEYQADARGEYSAHKSGYKAEGFGAIESRIEASIRTAVPLIGKTTEGLRGAAFENFLKLGNDYWKWKKAFDSAQGLTGAFDPKIWHGVADDFYNLANNVGPQTLAKTVGKTKDPFDAFSKFVTFTAPMIQGTQGGLNAAYGGMDRAYGLVRHGDAFRRREAEKAAKEKVKKESASASDKAAETVEGIDGTNARLDRVIGHLSLLTD